MRKSGKEMFHALHKVDMRTCYAIRNINLASPKAMFYYAGCGQSDYFVDSYQINFHHIDLFFLWLLSI